MDDGIIGGNPVARTGRLTSSKEDRRAHIQPLTTAHLSPLIMCAVQTGMRQGELIGLKWGDIDFRGKFIEVCRAVSHGVKTTTKSDKIRRVDMTPSLADTLESLQETRSLEAAKIGVAKPEHVFVKPSWTR